MILDKGQFSPRYTVATYLKNNHIPMWRDYGLAIAHNKIMIFDGQSVLTGSYNFTRAAQERNAENILIINNSAIAKVYTQNWQKRKSVSSAP